MSYELVLAKRDFQFSVAHFTIFENGEAERLHGHNYRARVRVEGEETGELGLLVSLEDLKREIRALCAKLDGRTLVPERSPGLGVETGDSTVEVSWRDRRYRLPTEDVLTLPLKNTSIEELALYFWHELEPGLRGSRGRELSVEIEETPGQSCCYRAPIVE